MRKTHQTYDLCLDCESELPQLNEDFYTQLFPSHQTLALFDYTFPIDHMITQLKFQHQLIYANVLGKLFAKKILSHYRNIPLPELIIPIPLHKKRLQKRGFNQAIEIAKPIAKQCQRQLDLKSTARKINTQSQSLLSSNARQKNVQNAFHLTKEICAKHIAIIDDVITTGHTMAAFIDIFKKSQVKKIDIWCCARTTPEKKNVSAIRSTQ